ncbi:crossover junction endonuclease EME1 [Vairimorpha necatrix]|uniref:Crossover junction endonuclease EME1 n=1 Tax=Vairimorpha necatrix TaxID=6039 RepID=A0AAX4JAK2_9MICR
MSDDSTSLSFLNLNWCESKQDTSLIYPFILEPTFTNMYLEISYKLEDLIKKIKLINFTYKIINEDNIRFVNINTKETILELGVCEYEKINFINIYRMNLFIVLNKLKYKKKITSRNNKLYKQNIEKSTNIQIKNEYEELKKEIYDKQVNNNINFIFVENENDLFRELKNILKFLSIEKKFTPKIKTFKNGREAEYMEYIISQIPGIGKCVAKNISERFLSLAKLNAFIQEHRNELSEMIIEDSENKKCRKLGEVQADKIVRIFMSEDPNEKIV